MGSGRSAGRDIWGLVRGYDQSHNVDVDWRFVEQFVVLLIILLIIHVQSVEVCSPVYCRMF